MRRVKEQFSKNKFFEQGLAFHAKRLVFARCLACNQNSARAFCFFFFLWREFDMQRTVSPLNPKAVSEMGWLRGSGGYESRIGLD